MVSIYNQGSPSINKSVGLIGKSTEGDAKEKIRQSNKYKTYVKETTEWLRSLDAKDSKPNDGKLDISVFNAKVAKFGYKKLEATASAVRGRGAVYLKSIDIVSLVDEMAEQHFFGQ